MAGTKTSDASASKLGYLYQCRYALMLALEHGDESSFKIGLETLDDVYTDVNQSFSDKSYIEAFQLKHGITKQGGTTDKHEDVWKTLGNWSTSIRNGKIDAERCRLLLVTTATASDSHAISNLRPDESGERDPEKARVLLERAGKSSKNDAVKSCFRSLNALNLSTRRAMFAAIELIDSALTIIDLRPKLEALVWMAVSKEHAPSFVERLEGWWFNLVVNHLADSNRHLIPISLVRDRLADLREQFRNDNLPDDFGQESVPEEMTDKADVRMFVRQLAAIGIGPDRTRRAQENHYKAAAQRSRWIRDKVLDMAELDTFELRLIDEWRELFASLYDGLGDVDASIVCNTACKLYEWSQLHAAANAALFIRPLFRSAYLTRGTFHMLADQVRVGWHREFRRMFPED